jgi:DNA polymerase-3 subunit delta'
VIRTDEIMGQQASLRLLKRMRDGDRVPHGLLFQGPEGIGKASVALAFAARLLCEGDGKEACGECDACRLIDSGNHPDMLTVTRLPKKPTSTVSATARSAVEDLRSFIVVDQIRELTRVAALSPRRGSRRLFVIDPADRMNVEAQNALLKTLEEPPGRAVLILVASRPHLLLPTVRSRCFVVGFAALRIAELAERLEQRGFDRREAMTRAALAEGRPGIALTLDLERHRQRRDDLLGFLESLASPRPTLAELPGFAADIAGKTETHLVENLELLQILLRDAGRAGRNPGDAGLVHADLSDRLEELGRRLGPERAAGLVQSVERLRGQLRFNLNRTLIAESILAAVAGGPLP